MIDETIAQSIRTRFNTQVEVPESLPTLYDNLPDKVDKSGLWCRFNILDGDTDQVSLGDIGERDFDTVGIAIAQIFAPLQTGDKDARVLAKKIETAFRAGDDGSVSYDTPSVRTIGESNGYWQVNVICPFSVEEQG